MSKTHDVVINHSITAIVYVRLQPASVKGINQALIDTYDCRASENELRDV